MKKPIKIILKIILAPIIYVIIFILTAIADVILLIINPVEGTREALTTLDEVDSPIEFDNY